MSSGPSAAHAPRVTKKAGIAYRTPEVISSTKWRFSHPEVKTIARPRCGSSRVSSRSVVLFRATSDLVASAAASAEPAAGPISVTASASGARAAAAAAATVAASLKQKSPPSKPSPLEERWMIVE